MPTTSPALETGSQIAPSNNALSLIESEFQKQRSNSRASSELPELSLAARGPNELAKAASQELISATERLKCTNGFSIADLVLNQSPVTSLSGTKFESQLRYQFDKHLHMGMGVLPVPDFESRQLSNKLSSEPSPIISSLDNKSAHDDDDIDDDSMSIKVDEEDKDTYVSGVACSCNMP